MSMISLRPAHLRTRPSRRGLSGLVRGIVTAVCSSSEEARLGPDALRALRQYQWALLQVALESSYAIRDSPEIAAADFVLPDGTIVEVKSSETTDPMTPRLFVPYATKVAANVMALQADVTFFYVILSRATGDSWEHIADTIADGDPSLANISAEIAEDFYGRHYELWLTGVDYSWRPPGIRFPGQLFPGVDQAENALKAAGALVDALAA